MQTPQLLVVIAEAMYFLWSQLAPHMAALAGNCSYFISTANNFGGNHADVAGAVLYSTNISSMQLTCTSDSSIQSPGASCPSWDSASLPANTVGSRAVAGYGPGLAFPPAGICFDGADARSHTAQISYISDGITDVPVPVVSVLDQAGNKVTAQPLRANVTVATVSTLGNSSSLPQLPGQTEASADGSGNMQIADLVLIAAPGVYNLLVALPDYPLVSLHASPPMATCSDLPIHTDRPFPQQLWALYDIRSLAAD